MNEVNKTLFIPLYGKAAVSRKNIILKDPQAEKIWSKEAFPLHGKSKSKWLAYNMAMRARVFDDWTDRMLNQYPDATVVHIGCGLDSRCLRVKKPYLAWLDCDLPDVINVRKMYYQENDAYHMMSVDASDPASMRSLPENRCGIIILEGLSMYLSASQLHDLFQVLSEKYNELSILMDIYTVFGAKASKYKNPVNDVGVTKLYGIDDIDEIINGLPLSFTKEYSFTPDYLINELDFFERMVFKLLFQNSFYSKIYRLIELSSK